MPEWLADLFRRYGYAVVFVGVLLEDAGVPAPGHAVLLAAGLLAQRGLLSLPWVVVAAFTAAILGDNAGYWIGRRGGRSFVERHERLFRLDPDRIAGIEAFFARHGAKVVVIARFVTGLQAIGALFAGVGRMPWWRFFACNGVGAIAWSLAYATAGYYFGQSWTLLDRWTGRAGLFALALLLAGGFTIGLLRRYGRTVARKMADRLPAGVSLRSATLAAGALVAAALFAEIAEDVVRRESTRFDTAVSMGLHRLDSPFMDVAMRGFTFIGSAPVVIVTAAAIVLWAIRRGERRAAAVLVGVALGTETLNFAMKETFQRARPSLFVEIAALHSYSFPSGHAMAAAAIYGTCAVVAVRLHPSVGSFATVFTPVLVLLIGVSRVFLGVHWATDVLAGYAAGAFILLAGIHFSASAPSETRRGPGAPAPPRTDGPC